VAAVGLLCWQDGGSGLWWLVKRRDKDLVGRLITLCCPLSLSNGASWRCVGLSLLLLVVNIVGLPLLLVNFLFTSICESC
jgi:hypothetical protein